MTQKSSDENLNDRKKVKICIQMTKKYGDKNLNDDKKS